MALLLVNYPPPTLRLEVGASKLKPPELNEETESLTKAFNIIIPSPNGGMIFIMWKKYIS
ncbi:hypothetical protein [Ectobacillus antri]|uniref:hypothetical protein n=1 Tax=Ectobacillus antri TaxID=2486280 RepID=UPI000F59A995|nr:hypothetical protein [Ectobacillus antri]